MSVLKGYLAEIKQQSSAVVFTDEATTTVDDQIYVITDTDKDIWAHDSTIVVKDDAVETTESYTVNKLTGTVTFATVDAGRGTITVSGHYVLLSTIAQAKNFGFTSTSVIMDSTVFNTTGFRTNVSGLSSGTATLGRWYQTDDVFLDIVLDGTVKVIEYYPNAGLDPIRFFALISSDSVNANVDGIVEESVSFTVTTELDIMDA